MHCVCGFCERQQNYRSTGNTTYYVNPQNGNDDNPGTSANAAWKTIARVNVMHFMTGDSILFAAGQPIFGHVLVERTLGDLDHPVIISSYGTGRATINGGAGDGIALVDCGFINVRSLNVIGCGRKDGNNGAGIRVSGGRSIELSEVEVSGFRVAGVTVVDSSTTRINKVFAHDNGYAGISVGSNKKDAPHIKSLYIGYCRAENNAGDPKNLANHSGNGIVVTGVDGALIEYCAASKNGWDMPRQGNGPVGIWGWNCDRLTIQHCISHHNKSPGDDGGGFDLDGAVTNSVVQYNLSYSNDGCGYLLCQYGGAGLWDSNTVRYNFSINDGLKNLHCGIGVANGSKQLSGALVYNNTIVNGAYAVNSLGRDTEVTYRNNIFVAGQDVLRGEFKQSRFANNLYWLTGKGSFYRDGKADYQSLKSWAYGTNQEISNGELIGLFRDPLIAMPAASLKLPTDPQDLAKLSFYRLLPRSPCIGAGAVVPNNGGRDFFGNPIGGDHISIGAHEAGSARVTPLSLPK